MVEPFLSAFSLKYFQAVLPDFKQIEVGITPYCRESASTYFTQNQIPRLVTLRLGTPTG